MENRNNLINYENIIKDEMAQYGNVRNLMRYVNVYNLVIEHIDMPADRVVLLIE